MQRLLMTTAASAMALGAATYAGDDHKTDNDRNPSFVSCNALLDATVAARGDRETTADLDNLVVDTRNGKAVYAIIDTNGILDSENKIVAIPYGALTWNPATRQFTMDVTATELRNLPECNPDKLTHLEDDSWFSTLTGIFGEREELSAAREDRSDEYTWHFANQDPMTVHGEIIAVNRKAKPAKGGECYAIVLDKDGNDEQCTVLLAPASYLNQESHVPSEGQDATVTVIKAYDGDGKVVHVARSIKTDGTMLTLRDRDGVPAWNARKTPMARSYYTLATTMDDGELFAHGKEFGSVNDVAFEAHSGTAAFAIISSGGVLGIDDTLYPIPCGAFTSDSKGNLYIDMPASKLKVAPKLSEDGPADLNHQTFARKVCEYYDVQPKSFDTDRSRAWPNDRRASAGN